jgi:hypothetical protein
MRFLAVGGKVKWGGGEMLLAVGVELVMIYGCLIGILVTWKPLVGLKGRLMDRYNSRAMAIGN